MEYKFYNAKNSYTKPINSLYPGINSPKDLYTSLLHVWSKKTCAPRLQDLWDDSNKTLGQCSITAFLAQDIFGGEVYGIKLPDGNFHCFNKVFDVVFDLTSEQFGDIKLDYSNSILQQRENHFAKNEKKERYLLLKNNLLEYLKNKK